MQVQYFCIRFAEPGFTISIVFNAECSQNNSAFKHRIVCLPQNPPFDGRYRTAFFVFFFLGSICWCRTKRHCGLEGWPSMGSKVSSLGSISQVVSLCLLETAQKLFPRVKSEHWIMGERKGGGDFTWSGPLDMEWCKGTLFLIFFYNCELC